MLKPDGIRLTAEKQVSVKRRSHVMLWKETPLEKQDMFHYVHFICVLEVLLCSCEL